MRSRAYFHYSSIPFPGGCWGNTMLWRLGVSSQLKGTFTKPEVLVEPLTFVTVHWNVRTAISYSTSVSFRLNLETNDSGSLPELFWRGGWGWGNVPNQCCLWFGRFGVFLLIVWLASSLDYWPLGWHRSPKAQYFKEFINRIVSYSSFFQRVLRARTGSYHNRQHLFILA